MRRLAVAAATIALALTACTGGGDDQKDDTKKGDTAASLPVPAKAPSARGPATGPALEPKVLLAASDELEELTGSVDTAQVERRSDAFISGNTVVGYSVDDISGYALDSGEQLWTSDLDLGGGTVCFVSQPDRAVKTFTVAYGDSSFCPSLATIRVSDGEVVTTSDTMSELGLEFDGEPAGGAVTDLFTVKGKDYLVDLDGVVWKMVKGEPEPVARLEGDRYYDLRPTPKGDVLIGSRRTDDTCQVDGYALPSFEHLWTQDNPALFPAVTEDCIIAAAPGNSALLAQETGDRYHLTQVDPATGTVLGSADAPKDSGGQAAAGEFDLASASNQLDRALGMPDGDTIYAQVNGLTRHSMETGKVVWDLDLGQLELESTEEYPMSTVLPEGVTEDGYLVASVSNNTAVDIVAVDVETGELAARWAVPPEFRNGFQVEPGMTLFEGGLVLTRNFEAWEFEFASYRGVPEPEGDMYDIGVFTFPAPDDNAAATAVPVTGPTDTDVKTLAGLARPAGAEGDRHAGVFRTGSVLVAHAANRLTGISPTSGKEAWTTELDPDPGVHVCVAPEPTQKVDTFLIGIRGGGEGARCDTVLNVDVADGRVIDRIALPPAAESAARIVAHEGVMYLVTGDKVVNRVEGGALVPHATLANQPYYLERTPQDPSLLISTTKLRDGREWAIEGYRLPSFAPVWSTTASDVFAKKIDRRNLVDSWRGNGLWISTTFGDISDSEATVKDSLVLLDPATGKVVTRTGSVERDYLADDLSRFSLTHAASAGYTTAGFDDGTVVLPQTSGVMRYSLADQTARWTVDISSIKESMERDRSASTVSQHFDVIDGGKTVLVTLSNGTSVELMTLAAEDGTITGRWNVPTDVRNGLQATPGVTAFTGGVALTRSEYSWDYAFSQSGREVPTEQQYDVGVFSLPKAAAPQ